MPISPSVLAAITAAIAHAKAAHPSDSADLLSAEMGLIVLMEEVGEVARAVYEKDHENFAHELAQVATVAILMLEKIYGKN